MRHRSSAQSPAKPRLDARLLARMLPYLAKHRGRIALSMVLLIGAKAATVALPLLLKQLVDTLAAGTGAAVAVPIGLLAGYGVLRLASTWFRELQSLIFNEASNGIVRTMSREVLAHLHELSLRFHLERHTGAVTRDIERGTSSVANLLAYLLFNIVPTLVELALIAFVLFVSYSAGFVAVTVATFAVYVTFTLSITQWRVAFRTAANAAESRASSQAIDSLINFETVKYFGNEGYEVERYDTSLGEWQRAATKSQASLAALNAGQALIITAGVTALMFLAADAVATRAMTVGDLVAVNAYLLQLFIPLGFLGSIYSAMRQAHVDMERMFELLERVPEVRDVANAPALTPGAGELRFEDVVFAYDPARPILRGASFVVPAGKKVAIVGPSGAGKSTIARLLFRLYDVTGGAVRIDGADVREVTLASVRAAIGVVPQDTVLFHDTLRANIAYGRRGATEDEVLRALRLADLERFVTSLPQGLDTVVGERGLKLSGGEKQRVAIARALVKAPRILLFDEATSSLDSASEQAILAAMRQVAQGHTTLVIAHRLSTVIDADEILVLDEGVIRERGTHATLLAAGGAYARLWQLQREQGDTQHAPQSAPSTL